MEHNLNRAIEKGQTELRDYVLKGLIDYARLRADEVRVVQPELAALLDQLADQTESKREKRKNLPGTPSAARNIIDHEQQRIIQISKEIEEKYPDEYLKIEKQNKLLMLSN